jgi:hypothetical protein
MDPIVLATLGAKYIMEGIKSSKTLGDAKEKALGKFLGWVQQKVFKNNPTMEAVLNTTTPDEEKTDAVKNELLKALTEQGLQHEMQEQLGYIQNILSGEVGEVAGDVRIGNDIKGSARNMGGTDGVNELKGKIGKIGGSLNIGNKLE